MDIHIVVLAHPDHLSELIDAFSLALAPYGNVRVYNELPKNSGDLNIYMMGLKGANIWGRDKGGKKLHVLCQLEELWNDRAAGRYRNSMSGFDVILDLYEENTRMNSGSACAVHFPLGYSPAFGAPADIEEDLDAYFFGSRIGINGEKRRWPYGDILKKNGFNVVFSDKAYGDDRTWHIRRSKVNLAIRHSALGFYCPLRALSAQCKGKFLLNEGCQGGYGPYVPNKHFVEFMGCADLIFKMNYFIAEPDERKDFAMRALEDLKQNHKFEDYLKEALKGII